jgi:sugar phosphate isomerase/epimerase
MNRRAFLAALGAACSMRGESSPVGRFQLGAISDGFSPDFEEALKTMKGYGLEWVEIREVYGIYNTETSPAQVKQMKDLLDKYQFRVSVIDSALYKCTLPGTIPVVSEKDAYPYSGQMELLKRACDRAHAFGAEKVRGFSFWRVATPAKLNERIAGELSRAAEVARSRGMRLVIENEETCNAATGHETAALLAKAPASNLGVNWDVGNGYWQGERSFPDGYQALDKKRIWHSHLKGVQCGSNFKNCAETAAGKGQNDLVGQLRSYLRDGYEGSMSLECEFELPGVSHMETTKQSLKSLLEAMSAAVQAERQ